MAKTEPLETGAKNEPVEMERMPTTFSLRESDLPELKDWKIGGKYTITMEVEQVSASKPESGKGEMDARFKVLSVESEGKEEDKAEGYKEEDDTESDSEDMGENETKSGMMGKHAMGVEIKIKKVPPSKIADIIKRKFAKSM
jgi:hypothetical protein